MKKFFNISAVLLVLALVSAPAHAWNLDAKHINALSFNVDGSIKFTLFENGRSGPEFMCLSDTPWFRIQNCSQSDPASCIAYTDRVADMLMNAKLSGKAVHLQQTRCRVFEVALKP